jgi:hypothetical protein
MAVLTARACGNGRRKLAVDLGGDLAHFLADF